MSYRECEKVESHYSGSSKIKMTKRNDCTLVLLLDTIVMILEMRANSFPLPLMEDMDFYANALIVCIVNCRIGMYWCVFVQKN